MVNTINFHNSYLKHTNYFSHNYVNYMGRIINFHKLNFKYNKP